MAQEEVNIFWMRRDLRLHDNHGLHKALAAGKPVVVLFIFDKDILEPLPKRDARVQFIWQELQAIKGQLQKLGSDLLVYHNQVEEAWAKITENYPIDTVFSNRDYEPHARKRDQHIYQVLAEKGISFKGYKDQVLFEKSEIVKDDAKPYVVYTPYMKKYKSVLSSKDFQAYDCSANNYKKLSGLKWFSLEEMGFESFPFSYPDRNFNEEIIRNYDQTRDIPSIRGTSRLSLHLRFGTISIRRLAESAQAWNAKYFNELIWRDFYQQVLYHFPHSFDHSFRRDYDLIEWEQNEDHFKAWCSGKTGYPMVDAGMRELNQTGFMHNRVRMVVASFLCKHLLIDWRQGEAYFAEKLLDYDAASNVGGWQWAAGSGVDAAPYFRVFNPELQLKKFDPELKYIKKWVPEYGSHHYPKPIVNHKEARDRALARYKSVLKKD